MTMPSDPAGYAALLTDVAAHPLGQRGEDLGAALTTRCGPAEVNSPLRLAHFVAQTCHETGGYQFMHELGGPSYFLRYDGRKDLGNTQPGDGFRFKGRGLIQITGRANYATAATALGLDLLTHPELAETPSVAVATALLYWTTHELNALADQDNTTAITRRINGGLNGLDERRAYLVHAKAHLGI